MADHFSKKKHYSAKLKERIAELERDLYKVIDGDIETITIYKAKRQHAADFEKMIWAGTPSFKGNGIIDIITQK